MTDLPFEYRTIDRDFFAQYLQERLPERIVDAHIHLNLPKHVADVPRERLLSDWALEVAHYQTLKTARATAEVLFPCIDYAFTGFPWPIREADLRENNAWLAELQKQGSVRPLMALRPEWPAEDVERVLLDGNFVGFKPYGDLVGNTKGAEISIFDFMTHDHLKIADRHRKIVTLHLPRAGRLPDDDNIRELLEIRDKYPNIHLIIAHLGRSYNPCHIIEGLDKLGDLSWFLFDTAAVFNPDVYKIAFDHISPEQLLYGGDLPITRLRGRREWTERSYVNLSDGDYTWNTNRKSPEVEATYTLYLYEQLKAMLDVMDHVGMPDKDRQMIFSCNAKRIFEIGRVE